MTSTTRTWTRQILTEIKRNNYTHVSFTARWHVAPLCARPTPRASDDSFFRFESKSATTDASGGAVVVVVVVVVVVIFVVVVVVSCSASLSR